MNLIAFRCFCEELEKRAVSPALMGRYLAGRAAQGVGGAAALGRQVAHAAAHGATTSRQVMGRLGGLGKLRLGAVQEGGLAARQAAAKFAPAKASLQARFTAAEGAGMYGNTALRTHEGYMGATHAYSPQYMQSVARPEGALHDPRGLMQRRPTRAETAPTQITGTAHTQLANANLAHDRTAVGQAGGRRLSAPGSPFGRTAVAARSTGLAAPQPAELGLTPVVGGWGGGASPTSGTVVKKRRPAPATAAT